MNIKMSKAGVYFSLDFPDGWVVHYTEEEKSRIKSMVRAHMGLCVGTIQDGVDAVNYYFKAGYILAEQLEKMQREKADLVQEAEDFTVE